MPKMRARICLPGLRMTTENGLVDAASRKSLLELAEDKAVVLNYNQSRITLPASVRSTFLMVFSPDGQRVASTHGDHKIYISELSSGKVVQTLEGHPRTPWCLAFHPSLKNMVASGCLAGEVRVWDLQSQACEVWVNAHGSVIASLAFHPIDHVILIATCNELHFWNWRQSNQPFMSLTTSSEKEKVRYVKFDHLGSKIVTGISNIPSLRSTIYSNPIPVGSNPYVRTTDIMSDNEDRSSSTSSASTSSLAARRSSLLTRVMSMYRQLEGIEDRSSTPPSQEGGSSAATEDINPIVSERTWERIRQGDRLRQSVNATFPLPSSSTTRPTSSSSTVSSSPSSPTLEPLSPTAQARFDLARDYAARVSFATTGESSPPLNPIRDPTNDPLVSASSNFSVDHSNNLMSTFRRLHSLCTRLAQLMQEQQQSPRLSERSRDVRSSEASTSLNDLLSRLQQSLQNMSTAAMTTAIAQEHIQQVRLRVAEILERLVNVSGYRARLSSLRDQIYEVAERIAAGSEPELGGTQRWDLIHCLWLVDMSIHLTRQMQRILAADYRLTQLTLSNTQTSSTLSSTVAGSTSSSSSATSAVAYAEPTTSALDQDPSSPPSGHGTSSASAPSISGNSSTSRSRFHPYSRWMIRSRSINSNLLPALTTAAAETSATFSIPLVRVSAVADEDMSPEDGPSDLLDALPRVHRERPRSPPLPEIQQVLNSSSSSSFPSSAPSSSRAELFAFSGSRYNFGPSAAAARQAAAAAGPPPIGHLWFPGISGWPMSGAVSSEFGLLHGANVNYRIQCWDFSKFCLPNLKDAHANMVVSKCRIHNDASVDISSDGKLLAALVPVDSSQSVNLCVYSLGKTTLGNCLYVWTFGANAISVALSPLSRYIVVGLTSPRSAQIYSYPPATESATVAQVLKLTGTTKASVPPCFEHVRNIDVTRGDELFSLNSIRWLPSSGEGLIYGTNRGHLVVCRPDSSDTEATVKRQKVTGLSPGDGMSSIGSIIRNNSATTGTQTAPLGGRTLSIGTQTIDGPSAAL